MRNILSIIFRLFMVAGFFLGLFLTIRFGSVWKVLAGVSLMIITVPLSYWLGAKISGQGKMTRQFFGETFTISLRFVGPIVLLFLSISLITYVAQSGNKLVLLLFILVVAPFLKVLTEAITGEIEWDFKIITDSFMHSFVYLTGMIVYMLGGLAGAVIILLGGFSLLLSLGDLAWHALVSSKSLYVPLLCKMPILKGSGCMVKLLVWHGLSLAFIGIVWRYGYKIDDKIISLLGGTD